MKYITVKEASELWNMDISTIGKLLRAGKITGATKLGGHWVIPKESQKPLDGRTRRARENRNETVFRFPLYINFEENNYVPPLSNEELKLRQAQKNFYRCEFQKSKCSFEELAENAKNIYVRICAHFFMCVLFAAYDTDIDYRKYYHGMCLLLSQDFPHKKEIKLFLPLLSYYLGQFMKISEQLSCDTPYEYHSSAMYTKALLSFFTLPADMLESSGFQCLEPYEALCRLMDCDGFYIESQNMHLFLFISYYIAHNKEAMNYHLKKAINIAYEHNLIYAVADAETYYYDEIDKVLLEYPESFAERIRKSGKLIYENFAKFTEIANITNMYSKLSKEDYRLVIYANEGYSNKQVAKICKTSERTVANRYNEIYAKLGVSGKNELVSELFIALGGKK